MWEAWVVSAEIFGPERFQEKHVLAKAGMESGFPSDRATKKKPRAATVQIRIRLNRSRSSHLPFTCAAAQSCAGGQVAGAVRARPFE
jgi:hypothetical protein